MSACPIVPLGYRLAAADEPGEHLESPDGRARAWVTRAPAAATPAPGEWGPRPIGEVRAGWRVLADEPPRRDGTPAEPPRAPRIMVVTVVTPTHLEGAGAVAVPLSPHRLVWCRPSDRAAVRGCDAGEVSS